MTTTRTLVLALAALGAGGAILATTFPPAAAQERPAAQPSVREQVEKLVPDLLSDREDVRERAAAAILALGDPARAELDRMTRDPDSKKAIAALKLLQSEAWDRAQVRRDDGAPGAEPQPGAPPLVDFDAWRRHLDRQFDDMQRRMREWEKQLRPDDWLPKLESDPRTGAARRSSGQVVENGKSLAWEIDDAGKVRVTTKDGPDAPEAVVEAPDLDALRRDHPDLAKRLDAFLPRAGSRRWIFEWPPRALQRPEAPVTPGEEKARPGDRPDGLRDGLRDGEMPLRPFDGAAPAPGPVLGIEWDAVPEVLRAQLDVPEDSGMVVRSVSPGTLAARLGLQRNDVLLGVAGRPVAGPGDVRRALETVNEGQSVTVDVLRKGQRTALTASR